MTEANGWILLWMLLMLGFGLMLGWELGDATRRRKSAEEQVELLREQLRTLATAPDQLSELRRIRHIVNDTHRRLSRVTKGLENDPPKPNNVNGRITPIRPFRKVWVQNQAQRRSKHFPEACLRRPIVFRQYRPFSMSELA